MSVTEQIQQKLGRELYSKVLAAYSSSPAAEEDDLFFQTQLSQAAYSLVLAVRNTLSPATLELKESHSGSQEPSSQTELEELSYLVYGLLRLEHRRDIEVDEKEKIQAVLAVIFSRPELFVLEDGDTDNYVIFNLLERVRAFYENAT